jgi:hypothetical protein
MSQPSTFSVPRPAVDPSVWLDLTRHHSSGSVCEGPRRNLIVFEHDLEANEVRATRPRVQPRRCEVVKDHATMFFGGPADGLAERRDDFAAGHASVDALSHFSFGWECRRRSAPKHQRQNAQCNARALYREAHFGSSESPCHPSPSRESHHHPAGISSRRLLHLTRWR